MLHTLVQFDFKLFHLINQEWTHPYLDVFLSFMRSPFVWVPLYVFLISFFLFNFGKHGLIFKLTLIAFIVVANLISSELIKKSVKRVRPCNEISIQNNRRTLVQCGTGYSFTSSHATNHFCFAIFYVLTTKRYIHRWRYLFLLWATIISYAQVYVGVHYPIDVMSGAIVGSLIGWGGAMIYNRSIYLRWV
ncbi:MAG: phosphatase PAP2 family protein [Saprospiraceae bacterium]